MTEFLGAYEQYISKNNGGYEISGTDCAEEWLPDIIHEYCEKLTEEGLLDNYYKNY